MADETNINELKFKVWLSNAKKKVMDAATKTVKWVKENPIAAATIAGAVASSASKGYRAYQIYEEKVARNRRFYDPRTGKYTTSRRNLRGWELDEIEERYNNGESYNSILRDLGLRK